MKTTYPQMKTVDLLEAMVDAKLQEDLAGQNRLREAQAR